MNETRIEPWVPSDSDCLSLIGLFVSLCASVQQLSVKGLVHSFSGEI